MRFDVPFLIALLAREEAYAIVSFFYWLVYAYYGFLVDAFYLMLSSGHETSLPSLLYKSFRLTSYPDSSLKRYF